MFNYVPCRPDKIARSPTLEALEVLLRGFYYPVWAYDFHFRGGPSWGYLPLLRVGTGPVPEVDRHSDSGGTFGEGRGRIVIHGRRGYIDKTGRVVIAPRFEKAWDFHDGRAMVAINKKIGYIDIAGKVVIPSIFDWGCPFAQGIAWVKKDGLWGFIDRAGKWLVKPTYESAWGGFSEGLSPVAVDGKWGYVDKKGRLSIPARYDAARPFWEELAAVRKGRLWGYVDPKGKVRIRFQFLDADRFIRGSALVELPKPKGRHVLLQEKRYAFIDKTGAITLVPGIRAMCLTPFSGGLAMAQDARTGKCGYIEPTTGAWVIPPRFHRAFMFSEGLAEAWVRNKAGYIDKTGKFVISPWFDDAHYFNEGLASVVLRGKLAYIDRDGKLIWRQSEASIYTFGPESATLLQTHAGKIRKLLHNAWFHI